MWGERVTYEESAVLNHQPSYGAHSKLHTADESGTRETE